MKQFFGKKSRNAAVVVIGASFALHLMAVLIFGTIKIASEIFRDEVIFEAVPLVTPPQIEPEYTVDIQQRNESSQPPMPKPIVVSDPQDVDLPVLNIDVNIDSTSAYGRGGGGLGGDGPGGGLGHIRAMAIDTGWFGSLLKVDHALTGRLYDLKKTADGKVLAGSSTKKYAAEYFEVLNKFVRRWDEEDLQKFYQAGAQLYTRQLFIPLVPANAAPRAFGAEKEITPVYWVAHYKGSIVAPFSGRMRFAGQGDNVLVVRFNRRVVLDASLEKPLAELADIEREPIGKTADPLKRPMVAGKWFNVKEGESYPMEVILGEHGGLFSCYLLVEVAGEAYEKQSDGKNPRLPVFQVGPAKIPPYVEGRNSPEIAKEPFACVKF